MKRFAVRPGSTGFHRPLRGLVLALAGALAITGSIAIVVGAAHAQSARAKAAKPSAASPRAQREAEERARTAAEIAEARRVFEANLDAIRRKDRSAYLACYLESESFARTGPGGVAVGYRDFADQASGNEWPDVFEASDLELVRLDEGLIYGTYRYRVRYGAIEQSGTSERLFKRTDRGWKIAVTTAFPQPEGTAPPPIAITGATLLDGSGKRAVKDAVIVLRDGQIEAAGPRSKVRVPAGIDTLDARGLWVTPGLIDAHVHYSQTGWVDGRPDALDLRAAHPYEQVEARLAAEPEVFHRSYLGSGVTAVFDVGGFPWTVALQKATELDTRAPHVVAAGPLLSTIDHWLNLPAERQFIHLANEASVKEGVRYLKALGSSAVKVWFIVTPDRDFDEVAKLVKLAGDEAKKAGLPLIVHATGLREAKAALKSGAKLLVHSVWDKPIDDEFVALMRSHRTIYCPTLTVIDGYHEIHHAVRTGRAPEIDDPHRVVDSLTYAHVLGTARAGAGKLDASRGASDSTMQARHRVMAANLKRLHLAGITIAMGTDAGNPLTLHGPAVFAEMEAMQQAGMSPMAVVVAATRGGAQAMGRSADLGTIEPGKAADLVVLAGDPSADVANFRRLRYVVRGGVVRPIEEFRARENTTARR